MPEYNKMCIKTGPKKLSRLSLSAKKYLNGGKITLSPAINKTGVACTVG
jgi:hypothetical protein